MQLVHMCRRIQSSTSHFAMRSLLECNPQSQICTNWSLAPMQLVHMCRSVAPMQLVLLQLEQDSCTYALAHVYPSAVLFEIIAQIQRKTGHGVETPPPRSFWCVCTCLCELICLSLVLGQPTANFTQCS